MIRRAFIRMFSGAIFACALGVKVRNSGVSYGWIERRGFQWEIEVPWEYVDGVCYLGYPRVTGRRA